MKPKSARAKRQRCTVLEFSKVCVYGQNCGDVSDVLSAVNFFFIVGPPFNDVKQSKGPTQPLKERIIAAHVFVFISFFTQSHWTSAQYIGCRNPTQRMELLHRHVTSAKGAVDAALAE